MSDKLITVRSPEGVEEDHTAANATDLINNASWTAVGPANSNQMEQPDGATPQEVIPETKVEDDDAGDNTPVTDEDSDLLLSLAHMDKQELIDYADEFFGVKIKATFSVPNIKAQIVGLTEAAKTTVPAE